MRTIAQIPARIKYLVAVIDSSAGDQELNPLSPFCQAFTVAAGAFAESSMVSSDDLLSVTSVEFNAGNLYKDLGRQVTIYDATTRLHRAVFREVQLVDGPGTGGVPDDYPTPIFIKVWSADGRGVYVARTGPGSS